MIGIIIMTITAFILSIILVNLERVINRKVDKITNLLPGYNCGACGFVGCSDLASNITKDPSLYKKCKLLKNENLEAMEKYIKDNYNI